MKFILALTLLANISNTHANVCAEDSKRLCPGIEPGKGQIAKCLSDHIDQLSPNCSKELKSFKSKTGSKNPCFEDLAEYCVDIPSDSKKLELCLLKNENRLGQTCSTDFKKKKGNLIVKDVCAQDVVNHCYSALSGPDGSITKCLIKNKEKLSKFCQNVITKKMADLKKKNPCFDDTEKYCPTQVSFMDIQECLEKKIPALSPECKKNVEAEVKKAEASPCYRDLRRHCKPGLGPNDQHHCLALNEKHLSNSCQQFRTREKETLKKMTENCEADRKKFCPNAPAKDGLILKCLKENKTKLSKSCSDLL